MPRKMNFEEKYRAGDSQPFHQRYNMFQRVRWDPKLKELGEKFFKKDGIFFA